MKDLTLIQKKIAGALEQLKEKSLITEAVLAKKIRENAKIQGKNKAGIFLKDLETCVEYLGENNQLYFSIHVNSANDVFLKKEDNYKAMDNDARKRRQASEKSISVLTDSDLKGKSSGMKNLQKRTDRKKIDFRNYKDFE